MKTEIERLKKALNKNSSKIKTAKGEEVDLVYCFTQDLKKLIEEYEKITLKK